MKTYILPLALLIFFASCNEENETIYSVDPALESYVSAFYTEAAERGVTIPRNLIAELKAIQGISHAQTDYEQNKLYFNDTMFANFKAAGVEPLIEAHVFYRLGGLLLHREISEDLSFMNPAFMFEPYNSENKEAMLDRLFQNP